MFGHAIDAAEVTAVSDGHAQIADMATEWINHVCGCDAGGNGWVGHLVLNVVVTLSLRSLDGVLEQRIETSTDFNRICHRPAKLV